MSLANLESLLARAPLVIDGGWGTELQQRGLGSGVAPEQWNLDEPDRVRGVAAAPEDFAGQTLKLIEAGAHFVGGCCGTNPAFIAAVRRAVNAG